MPSTTQALGNLFGDSECLRVAPTGRWKGYRLGVEGGKVGDLPIPVESATAAYYTEGGGQSIVAKYVVLYIVICKRSQLL